MNLNKFLYAGLLALSLTNHVATINSANNQNNINTREIDSNIQKNYENAMKAAFSIFFDDLIRVLQNNNTPAEAVKFFHSKFADELMQSPFLLYHISEEYIDKNIIYASNDCLLGFQQFVEPKTYDEIKASLLIQFGELSLLDGFDNIISEYVNRYIIINNIFNREIVRRKL